jgi:hypothetical protein
MNFEDWEAPEDSKQANDHLVAMGEGIKQHGTQSSSDRLVHERLRMKPKEIASLLWWFQSFRTNTVGSAEIP